MRALLAAVCAALVGWSNSTSALHQATAPVSTAIAVMRDDGVLVPFARFDATAWQAIWPEPSERPAVPGTLAEVPAAWYPPDGKLPAAWYFWPLVDPEADASPFTMRRGKPVTVERPTLVEARCAKQVGLATSYRPAGGPPRASNEAPGLEAGVVLSDDALRVERPVVLEPGSPLSRDVEALALGPFHRAEDRYLENIGDEFPVKLEPFARRRTAPVTWTRILRHGPAQAASRTYYLEGEIEYGPKAVMAGSVWVRINADRETIDVDLQHIERDQRRATRQPLGIVLAGGRGFWAMAAQAFGHQSYEIIEIPAPGRAPVEVVKVSAGGC
jgi:hypothetical protein